MRFTHLFAVVALGLSGPVLAGTFDNGGFENGDTSGWTTGQGYRGNTLNAGLTPASLLPGGSLYAGPSTRSAVIGTGTVDPLLGAQLGSTVYSGDHSYRIEDTSTGGYASAISQKVTNYTDSNIFFAWKAVLENGGHSSDQSAMFALTLRDDTTGTTLINRVYNAGLDGGGVDTRFATQGDYFYTPQWQIEQLVIDAALAGHDFTLSLLSADCEPTAHTGYAYLDGFGGRLPSDPLDPVDPPANVPVPGSLALVGLGLAALRGSRRFIRS
ncbi:MAG: PEP-CTERM sorting domain-containing protein [Herminiimonas sp.]|nr:PEP-CTERM sorting domain-containing protein [Herminiimonas sp.]